MDGMRQCTLWVDLGPGEPLSVDVALPRGEACFSEVLPAIYRIADVLQAREVERLAGLGEAVACSAGCAHCCRHLVGVAEFEALRLAEVVDRMPEPGRGDVLQRFEDALMVMERRGGLADAISVYANRFTNPGAVRRVQDHYLWMNIPCPFLADDTCSIYADRPLLCRQYLATSPPALCETLAREGEAGVEVVRFPVDLASAVVSFDGLERRPPRVVPLPLILAYRGLLSGRDRPRLDALDMVARFLEAAKGFAAP